MPDYRLGRYRGKFAVVWYADGRRHRHTLGTSDRREAERLLARFDAARPSEVTVEWLWRAYERDNAGKAVLATMVHTWKALGPHFGHHEPDAISTQMCRDYTAKRRRTVRDGTIHTELGHLMTVLNWALKRRHIERSPHVERPPKPAPRDRHVTRDEAKRLIDAATAPHVRLAIVLLLGTGARVGAVLDLTWDRVDFDRGLVHLTNPDDPTRRKARAVVRMNGMVRAALHAAREGAISNHVVEWAGKPVRSIKKGLGTAASKAGLGQMGAHVLRHTAAVWMAEAGHPMEKIAQVLGHSNSRITERVYARYSPDHLSDVVESLDMGILRPAGSFAPASSS